jgi:chromosome segregation ATPase
MNYQRIKNREQQQDRWRHRPGEPPFAQHMEAPFAQPGEHGPSAAMRQNYEEYLKWLQDNYPNEAKELAELKEQNPQLYMRKLAISFKTYGKIAEIARENPKLAEVLKEDLELRRQTDKLLSRIKAAVDKDTKQQLIKELEEVTNARFDLIVKRTQIRYEQLNQKLEQLKEEVKENEAKVEKWKDPEFKKQSVKARMEELLSKAEKFDWE